MKNIICNFGFIAALFLASIQSIFCQTVSSSDAETVAINFMKTQNPQAKILASHGKITGAENQQKALIYVFNFQPEGFVLVAGDKKSTPILGFSDKSNYDLDHLNPEAGYYLNAMKDQISFLIKEKKLASMEASWDDCLKGNSVNGAESEIIVGPFLTTKWNQGLYFNQFCPADAAGPGGRAYTGCVATAMAQLIKFHNSPAYGKGFHEYYHGVYGWQSANFENTKYNWTNMPDVVTSSNPDVAKLMYHCGVAVDMNYGATGSSAEVDDIAPAFQNYFSFSNSMQWITQFLTGGNFGPLIQIDLNLGHPTYMTGCAGVVGPCHAWLCDGYKTVPGLPVFYSMNWGWGGSSDGHYVLGNFNTGNYSFDWHLTAITGIEPSCSRNVNITNTVLAGLPILEAIETITTNMAAVPFFPTLGNKVNYDAGRYIQMNPGFKAEGVNVAFRAYIQGCGGAPPFKSDENEERSQEELVLNSEASSIDINVFPNPFTSNTIIAYELAIDQSVDIKIFNAIGNLVAQPVRQEQQEAGSYEYNFEANGLPTGVYFLVIRVDGQKLSKRLVLTQ